MRQAADLTSGSCAGIRDPRLGEDTFYEIADLASVLLGCCEPWFDRTTRRRAETFRKRAIRERQYEGICERPRVSRWHE